ncbi:MAG: GNAT family N-acetyltransferase [Clostridiaceae bacterium]
MDISDKELGKDYLLYEDLEKVLNSSEEYICKLAINRVDGKVVGFCLCLIISPGELQTILKQSEYKIPRALKYSEKIGVLKTTAVERLYQGYGIGKKLTKDCHEAMLKRKVQSVCSVAWKNGNKINISGILNALGYKKYVEIESYWEKDSLEKGYDCPACGKPPCKCSAIIYTQSVFEFQGVKNKE